jgi:hypothetical protein
MSETQIIDMLYLELSQFCKAKTKQELFLQKEIDRLKIRLQNREFNQGERDREIAEAAFESGLCWDMIEGHGMKIVPNDWREMVKRNFEIYWNEQQKEKGAES